MPPRQGGRLARLLPSPSRDVHQTGASSRSKPKAVWLLHKSAFLYHRKHGAHGPLNVLSAAVLAGLTLRALARLGNLALTEQPRRSGGLTPSPGLKSVSQNRPRRESCRL